MNRKSFVFISTSMLLLSMQAKAYNNFCVSLPGAAFAGTPMIIGKDPANGDITTFSMGVLLTNQHSCLTLDVNLPFPTVEIVFDVSAGDRATCTTKDGKTKDFDLTKPGTLNLHLWGASLYPICQVVNQL